MSSKQDRAADRQSNQNSNIVIASLVPEELAQAAAPAIRTEAAPKPEPPEWSSELTSEELAEIEASEVADEIARAKAVLEKAGIQVGAAGVPFATSGFDMAAFGKIIGDAVASGQAKNMPKRKVTFGEYDPKSAFHPSKKDAKHLTRACFQNGALLMEVTLHDREIELLNAITHSGRYIDRLIEVIIAANGSADEVHLRYNNKTIDQKLDHKGKYRSLEDMLSQIVVAQAAERAEDEQNHDRRAARGRR